MDRDRVLHLIMKYQPRGKRSQRRHPQKTSQILKGAEQVRRPPDPSSYKYCSLVRATSTRNSILNFMYEPTKGRLV